MWCLCVLCFGRMYHLHLVTCLVQVNSKNDRQDEMYYLSITNKKQRYTIFFITVSALRVSGGFSAHHQELKNCTHSIGHTSS